MASVGLAGSVGANVLTEVVTKAVDRLRGDDKQTSESSVEAELTAQLHQALNGAGNSALALREAAAHLLQQGAVVTAVVEDLARSDQQLLLTVAEGFAGLGEQFDEFAFAAADTRAALLEVRESLRGLLARAQEDSVRLLHVLEALRAMSISPLAGVPEHTEPRWHGCPYLGLAPQAYGLRATPLMPLLSRSPSGADSVRQRVGDTSPGSASSRPAKNPAICSGLRTW